MVESEAVSSQAEEMSRGEGCVVMSLGGSLSLSLEPMCCLRLVVLLCLVEHQRGVQHPKGPVGMYSRSFTVS